MLNQVMEFLISEIHANRSTLEILKEQENMCNSIHNEPVSDSEQLEMYNMEIIIGWLEQKLDETRGVTLP